MNELEKKYNAKIKKMEKVNNDNEHSHILQDQIYRKFIKDICANKFDTIDDIKKIASNINKKVIKYDKERWYG